MLVSPRIDPAGLQVPLGDIGNSRVLVYSHWPVFDCLLIQKGSVHHGIVCLAEVWRLSLNLCCRIDEEVWQKLYSEVK